MRNMADTKAKKDFERDEDGVLVCEGLAGQDYRACEELRKKEQVDEMPRDASGNLDCGATADKDQKILCVRQKASETARKSIGMKTEGDD